MNSKARFLLGGIGGLAPIILFLINLDFERYVVDATTWKTIGYVIRAALLFLLGGFVAYLHETEKKRITLFLVGVSAPSLIAGYLSTATPNIPSGTHQSSPPTTEQSQLFSVPTANAQPTPPPQTDEIKRFTLPPQSATSQFLEGLLGRTPKNVWFVIVGSRLDLTEARKLAAEFNAKYRSYKADVYAPYADNPHYAIVIGAHLTQSEAKALRDRAVLDGFPRDSYYKTFRGLPPADDRAH
jgi:hypothetical protein